MDRIFLGIWLPGMLYSFLITLSSNQRFYATSSASSVAAIASAVLIVLAYRRFNTNSNKMKRLASALLVISLFATQLSAETYLRYRLVFWDESPQRLNCRIDVGPEKGILTTKDKKDYYEKYYFEIQNILSDNDVDSVAMISTKAWLYPCFNREIASYSVWLAGLNNNEYTENHFAQYYKMNPQKIPDLFYIEHENYHDFAVSFAKENGYTIFKTANDAMVLIKK